MANDEIKKRVSDAIEVVRPYLQNDGGDISLVEVTDDLVVKVKAFWEPAAELPYSIMTLKQGVEQAIRRDVPEIKEGGIGLEKHDIPKQSVPCVFHVEGAFSILIFLFLIEGKWG